MAITALEWQAMVNVLEAQKQGLPPEETTQNKLLPQLMYQGPQQSYGNGMEQVANTIMGNTLGAYGNFGNAMQGAMGQMWGVNSANQQASLANRWMNLQAQLANAEYQWKNKVLGGLNTAAAGSTAAAQVPVSVPNYTTGTVYAGQKILPPIAPSFSGYSPGQQAGLRSQYGGLASSDTNRTNNALNLAGTNAENRMALAAQLAAQKVQGDVNQVAGGVYKSGLQNQGNWNRLRTQFAGMGGMYG